MTKLFFQTFLSGTMTAVLFFTSNPARANLSSQKGENLADNSLIAIDFALPGDGVPKTSIGGGVRGNTQFALPRGATPRTSIGGGVRGNTQFTLPRSATPRTSIGGGVRGNVQFVLPGRATPRTSIGAGVRSEEMQMPVLTALVPHTQHGRTVLARPTIFVYLPPTGAQEVFFSLQDEQGNPFYHATFKVPIEGGTIAIALPADAPELQLGKNYLWYLAPIEPGAILRPDNYAVTGWITRVESTVNQAALASSPVELANAYAKAGIWYDTLKVLADAQQSAPEDKTLVKEWQDLLEQVGLEAIADQPLAN